MMRYRMVGALTNLMSQLNQEERKGIQYWVAVDPNPSQVEEVMQIKDDFDFLQAIFLWERAPFRRKRHDTQERVAILEGILHNSNWKNVRIHT